MGAWVALVAFAPLGSAAPTEGLAAMHAPDHEVAQALVHPPAAAEHRLYSTKVGLPKVKGNVVLEGKTDKV
jgi:hypothetical protein